MPRIIAGRARGTILQAPSGEATRPTADRVKEALFSSLQFQLLDTAWLDVYAGSGQIGLEAVSRGAASAVFVEKNPRALSAIDANRRKTNFMAETIVLSMPAGQALRKLQDQGLHFHYIYLDPPWQYASDALETLQSALAALLTTDGILILEHASKAADAVNAVPLRNLERIRSCRYGSAVLSFYRKRCDIYSERL